MENKIKISQCTEKNGWYNITTNEGKLVSVMIAKCPKVTDQIQKANIAGDIEPTIECKIVEKDGKLYAWDMAEAKQGGWANKVAKGNESFALSYAKDLAVAGKITLDQIIPSADKFLTWLDSKRKA